MLLMFQRIKVSYHSNEHFAGILVFAVATVVCCFCTTARIFPAHFEKIFATMIVTVQSRSRILDGREKNLEDIDIFSTCPLTVLPPHSERLRPL